ncbi:MAG: hypothetical protein Ta2F_06810 [Termitinemataceae bacterium]|nr:MAG: hypothetical protein Ta2F_06810 [Termitinemataceae bacterium]
MRKEKCVCWLSMILCLTSSVSLFAALFAADKIFELTSAPVGAEVIVYDKAGKTVEKTTTPAKIRLKGKFPFTVEVQKENYVKESFKIEEYGYVNVNDRLGRALWENHIELLPDKIVYTEASLEELRKMNNGGGLGTGSSSHSRSTKSEGRGFITRAYLCVSTSWTAIRLCDVPPQKGKLFGNWSWEAGNYETYMDMPVAPDFVAVTPELSNENLSKKKELTNKYFDFTKQYTVHIATIYDPSERYEDRRYYWAITKIEDLLTGQAAEDNGKKQHALLNSTDQYDASKFTLVPTDFKPSNYTAKDLFDAAASVEKMSRGEYSEERFISDVVFVEQTGTTITFKTADGAISQYMQIDSRSGLKPNQKVRLYYRVTKNPLTKWQVVAIERM